MLYVDRQGNWLPTKIIIIKKKSAIYLTSVMEMCLHKHTSDFMYPQRMKNLLASIKFKDVYAYVHMYMYIYIYISVHREPNGALH